MPLADNAPPVFRVATGGNQVNVRGLRESIPEKTCTEVGWGLRCENGLTMARPALRLAQNVPGEFFVDSSCIDCDTCRQLAPEVFTRSDDVGLSVVARQPAGDEQRTRALMALVACPTSSIGAEPKADARDAARRFPEPIEDAVSYCGYTAESSFGASSYLVQRPQGNLLVDSPRAAAPLLDRIDQLGGVRVMFLTHRDDVADHARIRRRFGCERIIHANEPVAAERRLEGRDPIPLADDLIAIPVPGHTRGSTALLYREKFLFTGDHLWWSEEGDGLNVSRSVCWWNWSEQKRSVERLLDFRFEWVLPGHGRRFRAPSAAAMRAELERLVKRLRNGS